MKKLLSITLALLLVLTIFSGCNQSKTVKIAVAAPMTGDYAEFGIGFKTAVQIAVDEWNEKGGVLGKTIEMVTYDDKNNPEEGAAIAQKIVGDKSIVGVIGHFASGVTMAASPTYEENKLVLIAPSSSHPDYSKSGKYLFRNNTLTTMEIGAMVDCMRQKMGRNDAKVGVLQLKNDWGVASWATIQEMLKTDEYKDLNIVAHEEILDGTDDFGPAVTAFKNAGCEAILMVAFYAQCAPFAIQIKKVMPDVQLVSNLASYTQEFLKLGGDALNGTVLPVVFLTDDTDPIVKNFVDKYTAVVGAEPGSLVAQAYDSANIIFQAITNAGSLDKEKVRDAIQAISYQGVTGLHEFNEDGDAVKTFGLAEIKDGKFTLVK